MNPTPLPNPSPYTCRNCGHSLEEWRDYCPNCGAPMRARPSSVGGVLGSIFLGCGALAFGASGGCFLLFGAIARGEGSTFGEAGGLFGLGAVLVLFAAACIWGIVRINRRR